MTTTNEDGDVIYKRMRKFVKPAKEKKKKSKRASDTEGDGEPVAKKQKS